MSRDWCSYMEILVILVLGEILMLGELLALAAPAPAPIYTFKITVDGPQNVQVRDRNGVVVWQGVVPVGSRWGVWTQPVVVDPRPPPPEADLGPYWFAVLQPDGKEWPAAGPPPGAKVLVRGVQFGKESGIVWWNSQDCRVVTWTDTEILIQLPPNSHNGPTKPHGSAGRAVLYVRRADGKYFQSLVLKGDSG